MKKKPSGKRQSSSNPARHKDMMRHKAAKKEAALTERPRLISSCGLKLEANGQAAGYYDCS